MYKRKTRVTGNTEMTSNTEITSNTEMTSNAEIVHWAVSDGTIGHRWEFPSGIRFESFWKTIGAEEGDIWWY